MATAAERLAKQTHERHVAEEILPGVNGSIDGVLRTLNNAIDDIAVARNAMNSALGHPMAALEWAASLLQMREEKIGLLIEEAGPAYVRQVLTLIEQRAATIRKATSAESAANEQ